MKIYEHPLLVADGACGTNLQKMNIPSAAWDGREACNEILNLTAPELIVCLHRSFVEAGAMILESNTFGANRIVLAEYGLADKVEAINRTAIANARAAIRGKENVYVAGSMGPGSKLPSLGHIAISELEQAYAEQAEALILAGADLIIIETCQDLLQAKTAAIAVLATLERLGQQRPVMVSVTIEQNGAMLVGSDISAVCATFAPLPIFSLGLNCATGPAGMESHIRYLSRHWPGRISCVPNQGLPEIVDGRTCYSETPANYAREMRRFVTEYGVSIVGGCCGTTPEHIRALVAALQGLAPKQREIMA